MRPLSASGRRYVDPVLLPKPKVLASKDTLENANSGEFFRYWKNIPDAAIDAVVVKVYRTWPVIDFKLVDPNRSTVETATIEGALPFTDPFAYKEWFIAQYGAGEWKCILSENGTSGKICQCEFHAPADIDTDPPKIDYRSIVRGHFRNIDYIRQLQARNIKLPWDDPQQTEQEKQEAEEMAAGAEAVKTMADALVEQNKAALEATQKSAESQIELMAAKQQAPGAEDLALSKGITMAFEAAGKAVEMVKENSPKAVDPVSLVKEVISLVKTEKTDKSEQPQGAGLMTQFITAIEKANERSEKLQDTMLSMVREMAQHQAVVPTPAAVPAAPTFKEQLSEIKDVLELLGIGKRSRNHDDDAPAAPAAPVEPPKSLMQSIVENAPTILSIISVASIMFYNMRAQPGQALQNPMQPGAMPPMPPGMPGMPGMPMPGMMPGAAGPMPGAPMPQAATMGMPPGIDPIMAQAQRLMPMIEKAFIAHCFGTHEGLNGYSFANYVLSEGTGGAPTETGQRDYRIMLEHLGPKPGDPVKGCKFDQMCRAYDPIWSKVQGVQRHYEKFLEEFFHYDEYVMQQNSDEPDPQKQTAA